MSKLSDLAKKVRASSLGDARVKAHAVFDTLWLGGEMSRSDAYVWLCRVMNKTEDEGHIALFDTEECQRLIEKVYERERCLASEKPDTSE